jgi:Pyruvate/2-oxoacid:ferredoxin oxidoreductase delta subunit
MSVTWSKSKKKSSNIYLPNQTSKDRKIKGTINWFTLQPVVLEEGEVLCNKCNGEGVAWRVTTKTIQDKESVECKKCQGSGKLNWLENMMGGKKNDEKIKPLGWGFLKKRKINNGNK